MNPTKCAPLAALCVLGCFYKVQVTGQGSKKPSNVALFVQIDNRFKKPVLGLAPANFRIYENGKLVTESESKQLILNPQAGAVHYTMVLLDLSGSVAKTDQVNALKQATETFANKSSELQRVGVYAFDGGAKIKQMVPFTADPDTLKNGLREIGEYKPTDISTNLYGAVAEGLRILQDQREKPGNPALTFATLVVFTDGADFAERITQKELNDILKKSESKKDPETYVRIYAVGLGSNVDRRALNLIGRDGVYFSSSGGELSDDFGEVAQDIEDNTKHFYVLSYCSPARDGERDVKVKVVGSPVKRGVAKYHFSAEGFTAKCDPSDYPDVQPPPKKKSFLTKRKEKRAAKKLEEK